MLLLALGGSGLAGMWVGVGVVGASCGFLHSVYLFQRRGARRMPEKFRERRPKLVPKHRADLDKWVLAQWVAIGVLGGVGAAVLDLADVRPFQDVGPAFEVLVIGWVVLWSGVYLSSAIDWYLVLPKVSGVSCPGPCERPGQQRWAGITGLWSFHRGIVRLLVPGVLIGCPTVLGAVSGGRAAQSICFAIAAVLLVYLVEFEVQGKAALNFGLNPKRYVGDVLWLVRESAHSVERLPAYLVDVAGEGAKFKHLDAEGRYREPKFVRKHDDEGQPVALPNLQDRHYVDNARPPCQHECSGVNWYCWNNPLAHSQTTNSANDSTADADAESGAGYSRRSRPDTLVDRSQEQEMPQPRDAQ
ncbi:MAG TPA: hypothetical protein VGW75_00075 [Solirubrobacteraceae bacterium]|nr:hypothetical protein [Solirubrobacteraceae bacterium]